MSLLFDGGSSEGVGELVFRWDGSDTKEEEKYSDAARTVPFCFVFVLGRKV